MTITWCKECGRDLASGKCPWCDKPIRAAKSTLGLEERAYRCIGRNPGVTSPELFEYLELGEDQRDSLSQRLAELVRRGAIRGERMGNLSKYYVVPGGRVTRRFGAGRPITKHNPKSAAMRDLRRQRRENGQCVDCAQAIDTAEPWTRCEFCRERMRSYVQKRRAA